MATNRNIIDGIAQADRSSKTTMMNLWRENNEKVRQERQAPMAVAQDDDESRSELEQKIRNGEIPCPACVNRKYIDESDDAGVSFQTPTKLNASTAGLAVMSHEQEHVNRNREDREKDPMTFEHSTVSIRYDVCPECGRQYVCGGVTTTRSQGMHAKADAEQRRTEAKEDEKAEVPGLVPGSVDIEI